MMVMAVFAISKWKFTSSEQANGEDDLQVMAGSSDDSTSRTC